MPFDTHRSFRHLRSAVALAVLVIVAGAPAQATAATGSLGSAVAPAQQHDEGKGDDVDNSPAPPTGDAPPIDSADPAATVDALRAAERRYRANMYDGSGAPGSVHFVDRTESSPLVIVAPHAVRHHRAGAIKAPELFTGGIAEVLGDRLGASVLTVDGLVPDWGDDWAGRDDEFTRILHDLPSDAVIVDLHGMRDTSSEAPIVLGTGRSSGATTAALRQSLRKAFGADVTDEGRFGARSGYTVVDHMQRRDHAAIQIELAYSTRDPDDGKVPRTIDCLAAALATAAA